MSDKPNQTPEEAIAEQQKAKVQTKKGILDAQTEKEDVLTNLKPVGPLQTCVSKKQPAPPTE